MKNILVDVEKMPHCAEKILMNLICICSMDKFPHLQQTLEKINLSEFDFSNEINELHKRLMEEEINYNHAKEIYDKIREYLETKDFNSALIQLKELYKILRDINIQELLRLTSSNESSLKLIKDKNVYMLMGLIGSGQTTTLHFLGGSKLVAKNIEDEEEIVPEKINNVYLKGFTSESKNITPVIIDLDKSKGFKEETAIFCNTPGLEETSDQEVYISNRIAIQNAIETCKGIKPIVVASKSSGDRFEKLKSLTQAFSGMFINFEDDIKHMAYIYTQFKKSEEQGLRQKLVEIRNILSEGKNVDHCFKLIVEDMLMKSEENMIILDPINDDQIKVLKTIMDASYINEPKKHFKINLNETARNKIINQMNKHFSCIEKSILRKDFDLALFKFDELISLKGLIDEKEINERFNVIVQSFLKNLSKESNVCISNLNRVIDGNNLISSSNQSDYISLLAKAKEYEPIIKRLGDRTLSMYEELNENLIQQSKAIDERLKKKNIFNEIDGIKLDLNNLRKIMEIKLSNNDTDERSKKHKQELAEIYQNACNNINEKIEENGTLIKTSIDKNDLDKAAAELSKLKKLSKNFSEFSDKFSDLEKFEKLISNNIKNYSKEYEKILKKDEINDGDLKKIIEIDSYFHQAANNFSLHEHINSSEIENLYNDFQRKVVKFFESTNKSVKESLNLDEFNLKRAKNEFDSVQSSFSQMKKLRESENIERITNEAYADSIKILTSLIKLIKNEINSNVDSILSQKDDENYDKLLNNLKLLKKLSWVEEHKKNLYNNASLDIEEDILEKLDNLQRSLKGVSFSIENNENIGKTFSILSKMFANEPLKEIYPEVEKTFSLNKKWLEDELRREFQKIIDKIDENLAKNDLKSEINYDFIEQGVSFIEASKIIPDAYKPDSRKAQEKVQTFLKKRFGLIKDELDESFDFIDLQTNAQNQAEAADKARKMNNYFLEIEALKQNYRKTHLYLPSDIQSEEFLTNWAKKINEKYDELEKDIEANKQTEDFGYLNDKLASVKAFSKLENFLKEPKFKNLYNKYNIRQIQDSKILYNSCKEMIESLNFENLGESLVKFNSTDEASQNYINNLKIKLNAKLKTICKETLFNAKIVEKLDEKMLQNIEKNFESVVNAKENVKTFIENIEEINQFEKDVKNTMNQSVIKYLESIEEAIKKLDMVLGEQMIQHILHVRQFIELFIEDSTLLRINNLNTDQKNFVVNTIENFKNYEISEYVHHSPKEIYDKLIGDEDFEEPIKVLKKIISEKFAEKLDLAKKVKPPSLENDHLNKCERALNYLPDEIKSEIQNLILEARKEIEKNILNSELDLLSQLNNSDYDHVLDLLKNFQTKNQTDGIKMIKDFVLNQKNTINQDISKSLASKNVNEIFSNFEKFDNLYKTFGEHFPQLQNDFTAILTKIKTLFNDSNQALMEEFTTKNNRKNRFINEKEANLNSNYEIVFRIAQIDNQKSGRNIFMNSPETLFNDKFNEINTDFKK